MEKNEDAYIRAELKIKSVPTTHKGWVMKMHNGCKRLHSYPNQIYIYPVYNLKKMKPYMQ